MLYKTRRALLLQIIVIGFVINLTIFIYQQWILYKKTDMKIVRKLKEIPRSEYLISRNFNSFNKHKFHYSAQQAKTSKKINVTWIKHKWNPSFQGFLNVHIWSDWCGSTVSDLRRNIHFPKYPDIRRKSPVFFLTHDSHNYGQRVFGYLQPPKTGFYTFAISSDDTSELWLSIDDDPRNAQLIAWVGDQTDPLWNDATGRGEFHKYKSQVSKKFLLYHDRLYFVEALHKQSLTDDHLLVAWKLPGLKNFSYITSKRVSQYIHPLDSHHLDVVHYSHHIPLSPATLQPAIIPEMFSKVTHNNDVTDLRQLYVKTPKSIASSIFPVCNYSPSYLVDFKVKRFEGVYLIHETAIFPDDNTKLAHMDEYKPCMESRLVDSHGKYLPKNNESTLANLDKESQIDHNIGVNGDSHGTTEAERDKQGNDVMNGYKHGSMKDIQVIRGNQEIKVKNEDKYGKQVKMDNQEDREGLEAAISRILQFSSKEKTKNIRNLTKNLGVQNITISRKNKLYFNTLLKESSEVKENSFPKRKILSVYATSMVSKNKLKQMKVNNFHKRKKLAKLHRRKKGAGFIKRESDGIGKDRNELMPHKYGFKMSRKNISIASRSTDGVSGREKKMSHREVLIDGGTGRDKKDGVVSVLNNKGNTSKGTGNNDTISSEFKEGINGETFGIKKSREDNENDFGNELNFQDSNDDKVLSKSNKINEEWHYRDKDGVRRIKRDPGRINRVDNEQENIGDNGDNQHLKRNDGEMNGAYEEQDNRIDGNIGSKYEEKDTEDKRGSEWIAKESHKNIKEMSYDERSMAKNKFDRKLRETLKKKTYLDDGWSEMSRNAQVISLAVNQLKESGDWELVKKYAKENNLIFTKKTLRYVIWKYLHYKKPVRDKIIGFIYKQSSLVTCRMDGNLLLNQDVTKAVVLKYLKNLRDLYSSDIQLKRIVNVEENHDVFNGDRYLIELDVQLNNQDKQVRFSDYVYLPLGGNSLCYPKKFAWKTTANVHVIVPVKNQGKWVEHFINDMSELYVETLDPNFNVIIVDFNSTDIDIEKALARSSLKRYQVLKTSGHFQRALGVQLGANAVQNPNDILFTCDLHLEIPNNMIDILRKHCVQGKMAFSPMVLRLNCGFTPYLPYGEWETMGYGLFAIYKSDFDRIGGMNHEEFTTQWGGEDWEMVDRCLQAGMEIERLRVPNFYHYFHSKSGLWGTYHDFVAESDDIMHEDQFVPPYDPDRDYSRYSYNYPLTP